MSLKTVSFTFNPAGTPFIIGFAAVTMLLGVMFGAGLFLFGAVLTAWCAYFFRDPRRVTPTRPGLIVSPADGQVIAIRSLEPDSDLGLGSDTYTRISIFLNVFDVHVNRMPSDGLVKARNYRPGKFVNASLDKASTDNERLSLALQLTGEHTYKDKMLGVVQIAGLIARRIVCNAQVGANFKAGERYGIIRFGSRVDIYLPAGLQPLVVVGQRAVGGETILADADSAETARRGDVR
jgi:phosphatidylserine decarboxylase